MQYLDIGQARLARDQARQQSDAQGCEGLSLSLSLSLFFILITGPTHSQGGLDMRCVLVIKTENGLPINYHKVSKVIENSIRTNTGLVDSIFTAPDLSLESSY